jgi:hypothetical protein
MKMYKRQKQSVSPFGHRIIIILFVPIKFWIKILTYLNLQFHEYTSQRVVTWRAGWLKRFAKSPKVAGSIPYYVIRILL